MVGKNQRGGEGQMGFELGLWEREAVRERIIKIFKRMNILLNKCVK